MGYSTALHKGGKERHGSTISTLLLCSIITHVVFLGATAVVFGTERIGVAFSLAYIVASSVQVYALLLLAGILARHAWAKDLDPDNHVMPYLTALSDFIGTVLLVGAATVF